LVAAGVAAIAIAIAAVAIPTLLVDDARVTASQPKYDPFDIGTPEPTVPGDPLSGKYLKKASPAQRAEIADRKATFEEYQAAFARFRECLHADGYEVQDVRLSKERIYEYQLPDGATLESDDAMRCENREFRFTSILWVAQVVADAEGSNNDETAGVNPVSPAQRAEVEDGKVTKAEYDAAYARFRSCMLDEGHDIGDAERDASGDYVPGPTSTDDEASYAKCYEREFMQTDVLWLESHTEDAGDETMNDLRECLTRWGISPATREDDVLEQIYAADKTAFDCAELLGPERAGGE
jgi:hypothetical protein